MGRKMWDCMSAANEMACHDFFCYSRAGPAMSAAFRLAGVSSTRVLAELMVSSGQDDGETAKAITRGCTIGALTNGTIHGERCLDEPTASNRTIDVHTMSDYTVQRM